jgi:hypothetical protein
MIYRGPDFLAVIMIWLPPPSAANKLSLLLSLPVCRRSSFLTGVERGGRGGGGGGGGGAKSYDSEKALSSVNHSILSDSDAFSPLMKVHGMPALGPLLYLLPSLILACFKMFKSYQASFQHTLS